MSSSTYLLSKAVRAHDCIVEVRVIPSIIVIRLDNLAVDGFNEPDTEHGTKPEKLGLRLLYYLYIHAWHYHVMCQKRLDVEGNLITHGLTQDLDMQEYLIRLIQVHESFRQPELLALTKLAGIDIEILHYSEKVTRTKRFTRFPNTETSTDIGEGLTDRFASHPTALFGLNPMKQPKPSLPEPS